MNSKWLIQNSQSVFVGKTFPYSLLVSTLAYLLLLLWQRMKAASELLTPKLNSLEIMYNLTVHDIMH